jgi:DNA-binding FadR family transcriptional regulator
MTGNPVLALFAELINDLIDAQAARVQNQRVQAREPSRSEELLDEHDRVLALLEAGAAQEAARMWRAHLEEVHARLSTSVDTTRVLDLDL